VDSLTALPVTARNGSLNKLKYLAYKHLLLPSHNNQKKTASVKIITHGHLPEKGFVLDYLAVNSSLTNYTFKCDTTYYISGTTYLYGTNTFEGSCIIKYTNNASLHLPPNGLNWLGNQYRPVIFTSKDDNSMGDIISGSSGNPTASYYANPALYMANMPDNTTFNGFRIEYAQQAININGSVYNYTLNFYNGQIVHCLGGITSQSGPQPTKLRNVLFCNVATNFNNIYSSQYDAQNCTFSGSACLMTIFPAYYQTTGLTLTNCILVNVTNSQSSGLMPGTYWLNGGYNGFYNSYTFGNITNCTSVYPFQTVGDGHYYLSNSCVFHNWGTTNIDASLLAELPNTTTYPPYSFSSGALSISNNLGIFAQRDNAGNPDLGYHYDPLDYVFGGSDLYSNVTFSAGVAVGYHQSSGSVYSSGQPYGLSLNNGSSFMTTGTATAPCWVADFSDVQEGTGSWVDSGWMGALMMNGSSSSSIPEISATFTKWGKPVSFLFRDNWAYGEASFANCEFYADGCETYKTTYLYYTNCLLDRCEVYGFDQIIAPNFTMQNCTFYNGFLTFLRTTSQPPVFWKIINTSFDGTGFAFADPLKATNSATLINFNAYNTNNLSGLSYSYPYATPTNYLEVVGPNDQKSSGYNWQSSWFGGFYLPTNSPIIAMGSTNANLLGLYHFTTQTNQVVEGTNIVTIGYHYVATDQYGNPLDSNGDGTPDYLEDANGDGLVDNGETNWALAILGQPVGQTNLQGANVTFDVAAGGILPLRYQWYFESSNGIAGATNSFLALSNIQPAQAGSYSVVVTNQFGSISSSSAILEVNPTTIIFTNFCGVTNIQINGNATLTTTTNDGCVLELTPSAAFMAGSAFLKVPVALSANASFSTFFSFRLSQGGGGPDVTRLFWAV